MRANLYVPVMDLKLAADYAEAWGKMGKEVVNIWVEPQGLIVRAAGDTHGFREHVAWARVSLPYLKGAIDRCVDGLCRIEKRPIPARPA
jgi:hypothetical protein